MERKQQLQYKPISYPQRYISTNNHHEKKGNNYQENKVIVNRSYNPGPSSNIKKQQKPINLKVEHKTIQEKIQPIRLAYIKPNPFRFNTLAQYSAQNSYKRLNIPRFSRNRSISYESLFNRQNHRVNNKPIYQHSPFHKKPPIIYKSPLRQIQQKHQKSYQNSPLRPFIQQLTQRRLNSIAKKQSCNSQYYLSFKNCINRVKDYYNSVLNLVQQNKSLDVLTAEYIEYLKRFNNKLHLIQACNNELQTLRTKNTEKNTQIQSYRQQIQNLNKTLKQTQINHIIKSTQQFQRFTDYQHRNRICQSKIKQLQHQILQQKNKTLLIRQENIKIGQRLNLKQIQVRSLGQKIKELQKQKQKIQWKNDRGNQYQEVELLKKRTEEKNQMNRKWKQEYDKVVKLQAIKIQYEATMKDYVLRMNVLNDEIKMGNEKFQNMTKAFINFQQQAVLLQNQIQKLKSQKIENQNLKQWKDHSKIPVIEQDFICDDQHVKLSIHQNSIAIKAQHKTTVIKFTLNMEFQIVYENSIPTGIRIKTVLEKINKIPSQIQNPQSEQVQLFFHKSDWKRHFEWQKALISKCKTKCFSKRFQIIRRIKDFAQVYLSRQLSTQRQYTVKKIINYLSLNNQSKSSLEHQIKLLGLFNGDNFAKLQFIYEQDGNLYLVFQYSEEKYNNQKRDTQCIIKRELQQLRDINLRYEQTLNHQAEVIQQSQKENKELQGENRNLVQKLAKLAKQLQQAEENIQRENIQTQRNESTMSKLKQQIKVLANQLQNILKQNITLNNQLLQKQQQLIHKQRLQQIQKQRKSQSKNLQSISSVRRSKQQIWYEMYLNHEKQSQNQDIDVMKIKLNGLVMLVNQLRGERLIRQKQLEDLRVGFKNMKQQHIQVGKHLSKCRQNPQPSQLTQIIKKIYSSTSINIDNIEMTKNRHYIGTQNQIDLKNYIEKVLDNKNNRILKIQ